MISLIHSGRRFLVTLTNISPKLTHMKAHYLATCSYKNNDLDRKKKDNSFPEYDSYHRLITLLTSHILNSFLIETFIIQHSWMFNQYYKNLWSPVFDILIIRIWSFGHSVALRILNNQLYGLWKPEVQSYIYKGFPIIPILSRINPIPCTEANLFKINSNIALPSTPRHS